MPFQNACAHAIPELVLRKVTHAQSPSRAERPCQSERAIRACTKHDIVHIQFPCVPWFFSTLLFGPAWVCARACAPEPMRACACPHVQSAAW
eukprot:6190402-Pleurochrysis_carterae.AAC.2